MAKLHKQNLIAQKKKKLQFLDKYEKQKYIQHKLELLRKKLNGYKKFKIQKNRPAKIEASKTIHQLFVNRHVEQREPVILDEKLIYI